MLHPNLMNVEKKVKARVMSIARKNHPSPKHLIVPLAVVVPERRKKIKKGAKVRTRSIKARVGMNKRITRNRRKVKNQRKAIAKNIRRKRKQRRLQVVMVKLILIQVQVLRMLLVCVQCYHHRLRRKKKIPPRAYQSLVKLKNKIAQVNPRRRTIDLQLVK